MGLADDIDRADVQAALNRLLEDPNIDVRYFAIKALGPSKHTKELKAIAAGPSAKRAKWAARLLKRISEQGADNEAPNGG